MRNIQNADVIIIGCGLMGSSTALFLAKAGKKVILLDKEHTPCHASVVNAGGIRRLNRSFAEIPISAAAAEMWSQLSKIVDDDCGFQPVGQVRIAPNRESMTFFKERVEKVEAMGFHHEELVDADEIKRMIPAYDGECLGGIVTRSDGYALPAQALKAFFNSACSAGAKSFIRCNITDISHGSEGFTVLAEDGRLFRSEVVINCSGAWGKRTAALMGDQLPLEPVALSMMVTARRPKFLKPVVGVHGRKLSFKQMTNGTVVIGGAHTAFLDMQKEKTTINIAEVRKSAETVMKHFPIMADATIVRSWAGIEGVMSDGLPVIDESRSTPGFFHVCGFSAHGFQLSPMIGRLVTSLVLGNKPELSLAAFSIDRFKTATP